MIRTAVSTKSRTIVSTSRPTYPTSVNFVASILTKGAFTSLASRRAISVLPTPVGPIIIIFLGKTSSRISSASSFLRYLLRKATATHFFASFCPTIYLSNSATTCLGVSSSFCIISPPLLLDAIILPEQFDHLYKYRSHRLFLKQLLLFHLQLMQCSE